jgi:hypothetical protein
MYLPFIAALCPSLEKLTLIVTKDEIWDGSLQRPWDDRPNSTSEALLPLLNKDIRQIPNLKELNIIPGTSETNLDFAEPTVRWVKDRAEKRLLDTRKINSLISEKSLASEKHNGCNFCGYYDHDYAECYNLCDFCGEFGHFRSTCGVFLQAGVFDDVDWS